MDAYASMQTVPAELSFNAFVVSLATTAAVHFGDVADPESGQKSATNLEAAGHVIDMLVLFQDRTKGNLTSEEERFLQQVLFELRMRFVEAKKKTGKYGQADDGSDPKIIIP